MMTRKGHPDQCRPLTPTYPTHACRKLSHVMLVIENEHSLKNCFCLPLFWDTLVSRLCLGFSPQTPQTAGLLCIIAWCASGLSPHNGSSLRTGPRGCTCVSPAGQARHTI